MIYTDLRLKVRQYLYLFFENPYTQILAHPTGRLILRRQAFEYDMEKVIDACAKTGVALECNASPERLDLKDTHLRLAKQRGAKIVISTDAHSIKGLSMMHYGVSTARRGWIEKSDVINTLPVDQFLAALRPKPQVGSVRQAKAAKGKSA